MEVISIYFPAFVIISAFFYYYLAKKYRKLLLTILSCAFLAALSINILAYVLGYSLINYFLGLSIHDTRFKKVIFRTGVIINLIQIIVLKYYGFTIDPILGIFGLDSGISRLTEILVPVGISYFTLQAIGYLVNIYMGWEKPERNFLDLVLYLSFFPKFLSGPVERSNHFLNQIKNPGALNNQNIITGLKIALLGFFKKVMIADQLAPFINNMYNTPDSVGGGYILLAIIVQPLYLYFDFSGYTDIAIGFARIYGIDLIQNFNRPFLAENVTNFWKRFHISLTSWFNDYVFKQVSFRFRKLKSYASVIAVFVTWILFGIWHGAGWNFMVLGLIQAVAIIYEYFTKKERGLLFSRLPGSMKIWVGRLFTYIFYGWSLTFFFSADLLSAFKLLGKITDLSNFSLATTPLIPFIFGLSVSLLYLVFEIIQNDSSAAYDWLKNYWTNHKTLRIIVYYTAIAMIITQLSGSSSFVYQIF